MVNSSSSSSSRKSKSKSMLIISRGPPQTEDVLDYGKNGPRVDFLHIGRMSGLNLLVECSFIRREEASAAIPSLGSHSTSPERGVRSQRDGLDHTMVLWFKGGPETVAVILFMANGP